MENEEIFICFSLLDCWSGWIKYIFVHDNLLGLKSTFSGPLLLLYLLLPLLAQSAETEEYTDCISAEE